MGRVVKQSIQELVDLAFFVVLPFVLLVFVLSGLLWPETFQ